MDLEDHIPTEPEEAGFAAKLEWLVESGDADAASDLISSEMVDWFLDYADEPILFGLLKLANHVTVDPRSGTTCQFDTKKKCLNIPFAVALRIESMHDIACLLLIERSRIIANRSAHTFIPDGMDLDMPSHGMVFELALSCWSVALSRCYCASTLPEKLYAMYSDMFHSLMHGLAPDQFAQLLRTSMKLPNVADTYLALYNMGGQEMYHAALNRVASGSTNTLSFMEVLDSFWTDFQNHLPKRSDSDDAMSAVLVVNTDGEDEKPHDNMQSLKAYGHSNHLKPVPVADIDVESDLDQYIANFMKLAISKEGFFGNRLHGLDSRTPNALSIRACFDSLQHSVMLEAEANDEDAVYGSITPPMHPSQRDLAMYMQGYPPALWETPMAANASTTADVRYGLYFDISGSMFSWFPVVRALIRILGVYLDPNHIYGFSNSVVPIDMCSSFLMTTYGTDIDDAVQHARANNVTHSIFITDLGASQVSTTEGLEHIIIVGTDIHKNETVENSCFQTHSPDTKIDLYHVKLRDITNTPIKGRSSFNDGTLASPGALNTQTSSVLDDDQDMDSDDDSDDDD